jgi:hypothetical protein
MRRKDYQLAILPPGGFGPEHLFEQRLDEVFRLGIEAVAGVALELGAAEQAGGYFLFSKAALDH